jgi:hypothetical protein
MKKRGKPKEKQLTRTLPATRVTEETYQSLLKRMEDEKRRKISETVRLTLEDYFAEAQPA